MYLNDEMNISETGYLCRNVYDKQASHEITCRAARM